MRNDLVATGGFGGELVVKRLGQLGWAYAGRISNRCAPSPLVSARHGHIHAQVKPTHTGTHTYTPTKKKPASQPDRQTDTDTHIHIVHGVLMSACRSTEHARVLSSVCVCVQ